MEDAVGVVIRLVSVVVGGVVSWMVGGIGLAMTILIGLMLADFITGLMVGYVDKSLKSSTGVKGLLKKTYILILLGCTYLVQASVPALNNAGPIADGIVIMYIVIEFLSIVENGGKLGVPIGPLKNVIEVLKKAKGDSDDDQKGV